MTEQSTREHDSGYAQDSNTEAPEATATFEQFVDFQLQALLQSDTSPKETSDAIATSFCRQQKPEDCFYTLTWAVLSAAQDTDDARLSRLLAQLMLELCLRPQARNESGVDMEMEGNTRYKGPLGIKPGEPIVDATGLRYFSHAPWFSMNVGEAWNGPVLVGPYAETNLDLVRDQFANLNVFLAHLALAGTSVEESPFGTWPETFGLMAIANGLETPDRETPDDHVRVAAKWFQICGRVLYDRPDWGLYDDGSLDGPKGRLWKAKEWEDNSADARWNFWVQRASELATSTSANKGVWEAATECLRQISNVSTTTTTTWNDHM